MKCPFCGAETKNDVCEFCGSDIPKEKSQATLNITNNYYSSEQSNDNVSQVSNKNSNKKKKTPIWLWVLGWICIFPLPLTILLLRKKEMKPAIKYGIIVIAWIIYILIGFSGTSSDNNSTQSNNDSTNVTEVDDKSDNKDSSETNTETTESVSTVTEASESETETEESLAYFESNETVNNFFVRYNEIAENKVENTDIKKGNIDTKALVYKDSFSFEVIATNDILYLSIGSEPDFENDVMYAVFRDSIKAMFSDMADEQIDEAWSGIHETGFMVEGYELDNIKIGYVPYKELSQGHSNLRIDLEIPIE